MNKIIYNKKRKLEKLNQVEDIDPPIYKFLIALNSIKGVLTKYSCSGHFCFYNSFEDIIAQGWFQENSIHFSNAYIVMDKTKEALSLIPLFEHEGFDYNIQKSIHVCKGNTKVDWNHMEYLLSHFDWNLHTIKK